MNNKYRFDEIENKLNNLGVNRLDVLFAGVTGAGKSSTINALFGKEICKVGYGVDPETMEISSCKINEKLFIWDTPGLGDDTKKDVVHSKKIIDLLRKNYGKKRLQWIDLAFIIIEGSKRDLGTTYQILDTIINNFPGEKVLVAINQADAAMSGKHWDYENNLPKAKLIDHLEKFSAAIQNRFKENSGVLIPKPIYYSAKYNYNLNIFYDFLIDYIPKKLISIKR